jgi:hypothetical protein
VKDTGRLAAVFLQGGKERCVVAFVDALENAEMEFEIVLVTEEDPREDTVGPAGDILDAVVRHEK